MTLPFHSKQRAATAQNIIFVLDFAYSQRDHLRFGVHHFLDRGFNVEVWNLCEIAFPTSNVSDEFAADSRLKYFRVRSHEEFSLRVEAISSRPLVFFVGNQHAKLRKYFRALKSRGAILCSVVATVHPVSLGVGTKSNFQNQLYRSMRILRRGAGLALRKAIRLINPAAKADFVFVAGESAKTLVSELIDRKTRVIPICSFDHDRLLEAIKASSPVAPGYCVFLDEFLPFHPDYEALGVPPPIRADDYYPRLRDMFHRIERATGLRVVVAAHPRAKYSQNEEADFFGGRTVFRNETATLVKSADLVLAHASTALSYAVIGGKPICLIDSMRFRSNGMRAGIDVLVSYLQPAVVYLERGIADDFTVDRCRVSVDRFREYRRQFVKVDEAPERLSYEVMGDFVEALLTDR